jgi:hypothetical protein
VGYTLWISDMIKKRLNRRETELRRGYILQISRSLCEYVMVQLRKAKGRTRVDMEVLHNNNNSKQEVSVKCRLQSNP